MASITRETISGILDEACRGSRRVEITMKNGKKAGKLAANHLMDLVDKGQIVVATGVYLVLMAVGRSGLWMDLTDRQFMATLTDKFDAQEFMGLLAGFIENMEVAG